MSICSALIRQWKKFSTLQLLVFWVLGSALGIFYARVSCDDVIPLVRLAATQSVSLGGILLIDALPLLLCALAVFCSELWLIPIFGGLKAFAFSYNSCAVSMAFGDAGWLVRCLLLFSDMLLIPGLCIFCIRYGSGNRELLRREGYIWLLVVFVIGSLDYRYVSTFLASLF